MFWIYIDYKPGIKSCDCFVKCNVVFRQFFLLLKDYVFWWSFNKRMWNMVCGDTHNFNTWHELLTQTAKGQIVGPVKAMQVFWVFLYLVH